MGNYPEREMLEEVKNLIRVTGPRAKALCDHILSLQKDWVRNMSEVTTTAGPSGDLDKSLGCWLVTGCKPYRPKTAEELNHLWRSGDLPYLFAPPEEFSPNIFKLGLDIIQADAISMAHMINRNGVSLTSGEKSILLEKCLQEYYLAFLNAHTYLAWNPDKHTLAEWDGSITVEPTVINAVLHEDKCSAVVLRSGTGEESEPADAYRVDPRDFALLGPELGIEPEEVYLAPFQKSFQADIVMPGPSDESVSRPAALKLEKGVKGPRMFANIYRPTLKPEAQLRTWTPSDLKLWDLQAVAMIPATDHDLENQRVKCAVRRKKDDTSEWPLAPPMRVCPIPVRAKESAFDRYPASLVSKVEAKKGGKLKECVSHRKALKRTQSVSDRQKAQKVEGLALGYVDKLWVYEGINRQAYLDLHIPLYWSGTFITDDKTAAARLEELELQNVGHRPLAGRGGRGGRGGGGGGPGRGGGGGGPPRGGGGGGGQGGGGPPRGKKRGGSHPSPAPSPTSGGSSGHEGYNCNFAPIAQSRGFGEGGFPHPPRHWPKLGSIQTEDDSIDSEAGDVSIQELRLAEEREGKTDSTGQPTASKRGKFRKH